MNRTLTIRLHKAQDDALTGRARALGKTRSELVRDLIDQAVGDTSIAERAGHVKGRITLPRARGGWRRVLKERNWR